MLASAVSLSGALPAGAEPTPVAKAARQPLRLLFNEAAPASGSFSTLVNSGSARLQIRVAKAYGGVLTRGRSRTGGANRALRTPRHDAAATAPRAVIKVVDSRGPDNLDPGAANFTFGADVLLDRVSQDVSEGSYDNGDNVVQRGLFGAVSQYKIQLDHEQATCRVHGSAGTVVVTSRRQIVPGTWYRVRCARTGTAVSIAVTSWRADGEPLTTSDTASGATGSLRPEAQSVPLTVGGKLTSSGEFVSSTDQLNGRVDNVVVRIG
jgi:hypothetical protein